MTQFGILLFSYLKILVHFYKLKIPITKNNFSENCVGFLGKITFRCILISWFRQIYEFCSILISWFEQKMDFVAFNLWFKENINKINF